MPTRKRYNDGGIVASTILEQLGGIGRIKAMTGAYNFVDIGNGVSFRIKNQRANYVKIKLNSMDLYDLEIGRIRGDNYTIVSEHKNVYAEDLKPLIEKASGLYLSFAEGGMAKGGELEIKNKLSKSSFSLPYQIAVYVPSTKDKDVVISKKELDTRVDEVKKYLAQLFGGFNSVKVEGGYQSQDKGLIKEDAVRVVAFGNKENIDDNFKQLISKVKYWCTKWGQESMGVEFENDMYYVDENTKFEDGGIMADGGEVVTFPKKKISYVDKISRKRVDEPFTIRKGQLIYYGHSDGGQTEAKFLSKVGDKAKIEILHPYRPWTKRVSARGYVSPADRTEPDYFLEEVQKGIIKIVNPNNIIIANEKFYKNFQKPISKMLKSSEFKEAFSYLDGEKMADGGEIFQIKDSKDRYYSTVGWKESPDLGYQYSLEDAEKLVKSLAKDFSDLQIVKYNKDWWKMADGGMTDDEGNMIDFQVGDVVVEYKRPNANQPKREYGGKGKIISIAGAMAKVIYEPDYEKWVALKNLKKVENENTKFALGGYADLSKEKPSIMQDSKSFKVPEIDLVKIDDRTFKGSQIIRGSEDAVDVFRQFWNKNSLPISENLNVMFLNQANKVIGIYQHSKGSVNGTIADPEMIALAAVKSLAKGVIIAHNHPSGNLKPSQSDIDIANKIKNGLKLFDIKLLDSLIITEDSYNSLDDLGVMAKGGILGKKYNIVKGNDGGVTTWVVKDQDGNKLADYFDRSEAFQYVSSKELRDETYRNVVLKAIEEDNFTYYIESSYNYAYASDVKYYGESFSVEIRTNGIIKVDSIEVDDYIFSKEDWKIIGEFIKELKDIENDEYARGGKVKNKWIQEALKNDNQGALRRTAKRKGLLRGDENLSKSDLDKLQKMGGKTAKRAHLAETLRKFK